MSKPARPEIPAEPNASDEPHDVLAAEQFAMPAPEAALIEGPIVLPRDPTGTDEPHDVLAAEAFAMPAPRPGTAFAAPAATRSRGGVARLAAGVGLVLGALAHRRHRARRR